MTSKTDDKPGYPCLTERPGQPGVFHLTTVRNIHAHDADYLAKHSAEMVMWPHWLDGFMVRLTVNHNGEEISVTERVTRHYTCFELIAAATRLLRREIERADAKETA